MGRVLVVDDEQSMREFLAICLRRAGHDVEVADSGAAALGRLKVTPADVVITDLRMPGALDGLGLLGAIKDAKIDAEVILVTAFASADTALSAMKNGAYDYLTKPFKVDEINAVIGRAMEKRALVAENLALRRQVSGRIQLARMLGKSRAMQKVFELIDKVHSTKTSVLITGESGTGKELVARAIHYRSDRAQAPLMEVNCSSFQETLLENELFGHEKGAFTDASDMKKGLVELCDGGTLFLDEVADMSLPTQAKLLRFIDYRSFKRVGGSQDVSVDIRIVAATNKDLDAEVRAGRFRSDLYFRLKVVSIHLPPLRDRGDDILLLARHFLVEFARKFQKGFHDVTPDAARVLATYRWPGNVRELRNLIERVALLEDGELLEHEHLPHEFTGRRVAPDPTIASPTLAQIEADHITEVLRLTSGNKSRAARILGISRQGLIEKLRRLRLEETVGRPVS